MLFAIILFLPFGTCLFWMLIHSLMTFRTSGFSTFMVLFAIGALFSLADASYVCPGIPAETLTLCTLLSMLTAPSVIPALWGYMHRLRNPSGEFRPHHNLWVIVPVVIFTAGVVLILLSEPGRIAGVLKNGSYLSFADLFSIGQDSGGYFALLAFVVVRAMVLIELVYAAVKTAVACKRDGYSLRHLGAFLRGDKIRVPELQVFTMLIPVLILIAKMAVPKSYEAMHPWIPASEAIVLTLFLSFFAFAAMFGMKNSVTIAQMLNGFRYNFGLSDKGAVVERMIADLVDDAEEEALLRIQAKIGKNLHIDQFRSAEVTEETPTVASNIFNAVANSWDEDSLLSRFQSLMMNEQLFLNPRLTLSDVAEKLSTNKTYISKLVNNTYNLGFPELINTLRIDFAEQYILKNRNAKQEEIARECGFLSASSFNITFKKVTGMTPKVWISSVDKHSR